MARLLPKTPRAGAPRRASGRTAGSGPTEALRGRRDRSFASDTIPRTRAPEAAVVKAAPAAKEAGLPGAIPSHPHERGGEDERRDQDEAGDRHAGRRAFTFGQVEGLEAHRHEQGARQGPAPNPRHDRECAPGSVAAEGVVSGLRRSGGGRSHTSLLTLVRRYELDRRAHRLGADRHRTHQRPAQTEDIHDLSVERRHGVVLGAGRPYAPVWGDANQPIR